MTNATDVWPTRGGAAPLLLSDRQGFDRRWYAPDLAAVYVPGRVEEVAACVAAAIGRYGRDVKIVSGRHCYEGFVYAAGTRAVIDLSALNQVGRDPATGMFFVDAGCENWTVYRTLLNGFGRTLPAGSCYSVGAGGHITGGGYGLLSRLHGLTIDHLTAVDIVVWDAAERRAVLRRVSDDSADAAERDLFWALRGAGCGNFGVIVRYHFAHLPAAPDHASLYALAWDWSDMTEARFALLLAEYARLVAGMPETDFCLLKLAHESFGQIGLVYQGVSAPGVDAAVHRASFEDVVHRLRARFGDVAPPRALRRPFGGHPGLMTTHLASETATHLTYLEALQTLNGSGPNQFGKYKSAYMRKAFPADQARAIYAWLHRVPDGVTADDMQQSLLQVDSYGGRINRVGPAETAVPQRDSIMKLQYQTYWSNASTTGQPLSPADRAQQEAHLAWIRGFYADVYVRTGSVPDPARDATGTVDGCYFNYPDVDLGSHAGGGLDEALRLYFGDNYRRAPRNLVAVKARWDPDGIFNHAQSLPTR